MKTRTTLAMLVAMSTAAAAGQHLFPATTVRSTYADGSIGAARNASGYLQVLGCELYANKTYSSVTCTARDKDGVSLTCYSRTNEMMKQAVTAIAATSYIYFATD